MSDLFYLYGFVPEGTPAPPPEVTGLEDRPVELVGVPGFAAAFSRVPADEYGEAVLEERVNDLRWMSGRAFLHEQVVTWFVDRDGIVPARFLTLHGSLSSLIDEAQRRASVIEGLLSRLGGRREWDLRLTFEAERLAEKIAEDVPEVAELDRKIATASPGRAYLLQRRRDETARERAEEVAVRLGSELVELLEGAAERVTRGAAPSRSKEEKAIAAEAAFLVARDDEERFQALAEERARALAERGFDVRLTGPWAPYRFIGELDDSPVEPEPAGVPAAEPTRHARPAGRGADERVGRRVDE